MEIVRDTNKLTPRLLELEKHFLTEKREGCKGFRRIDRFDRILIINSYFPHQLVKSTEEVSFTKYGKTLLLIPSRPIREQGFTGRTYTIIYKIDETEIWLGNLNLLITIVKIPCEDKINLYFPGSTVISFNEIA